MRNIKDWKPGEYKASVKIITDRGTTLDFYIPHLPIEQGEHLVRYVTELFVNEENRVKMNPDTNKLEKSTLGK